jgi:ribosome-binding protein aMBF1 (putative translation factor)
MTPKTESYRDLLADRLKDPAFREAYEALEPAFQIARLRIAQGLTQAELAARMGTRQSYVARIESGQQNITVETLRRAAEALGARLTIHLEPCGT